MDEFTALENNHPPAAEPLLRQVSRLRRRQCGSGEARPLQAGRAERARRDGERLGAALPRLWRRAGYRLHRGAAGRRAGDRRVPGRRHLLADVDRHLLAHTASELPEEFAANDEPDAPRCCKTESGHRPAASRTRTARRRSRCQSSAEAVLEMDPNGSFALTDSGGATVTLDADAERDPHRGRQRQFDA